MGKASSNAVPRFAVDNIAPENNGLESDSKKAVEALGILAVAC